MHIGWHGLAAVLMREHDGYGNAVTCMVSCWRTIAGQAFGIVGSQVTI
jgi:hypothetical protein